MPDTLDKMLIALGIKEEPPSNTDIALTGLGMATTAYTLPDSINDAMGVASRRVIGDAYTGTGPTGLNSGTFDPARGASARKGNIIPSLLARSAGSDGVTNQKIVLPHEVLMEHMEPPGNGTRMTSGWDIPTKYIPGSDDYSRLHVLREAVEKLPDYIRNNKLNAGLGIAGTLLGVGSLIGGVSTMADHIEKRSSDKLAWGLDERASDRSVDDWTDMLAAGSLAGGATALAARPLQDGMFNYAVGKLNDGVGMSEDVQGELYRQYLKTLPADQAANFGSHVIPADVIENPHMGPFLAKARVDGDGLKQWLGDSGSASTVKKLRVGPMMHEMGHGLNFDKLPARMLRNPVIPLASTAASLGMLVAGDEETQMAAAPVALAGSIPLLAEEARANINSVGIRKKLMEAEGLSDAALTALKGVKWRNAMPAYGNYMLNAAVPAAVTGAAAIGHKLYNDHQESQTPMGKLKDFVGM